MYFCPILSKFWVVCCFLRPVNCQSTVRLTKQRMDPERRIIQAEEPVAQRRFSQSHPQSKNPPPQLVLLFLHRHSLPRTILRRRSRQFPPWTASRICTTDSASAAWFIWGHRMIFQVGGFLHVSHFLLFQSAIYSIYRIVYEFCGADVSLSAGRAAWWIPVREWKFTIGAKSGAFYGLFDFNFNFDLIWSILFFRLIVSSIISGTGPNDAHRYG